MRELDISSRAKSVAFDHHPFTARAMTPVSSNSPLLSIFAGDQTCIGFVFNRGRTGFEGFDQQRSLGLFESQAAAVARFAEKSKQEGEIEHDR
jgi:hypothetical protein